jgi:lysophospholipase L1-like esterase
MDAMKRGVFLLLAIGFLVAAPWRVVLGAAHNFAKWEKEIAAFEAADRTNPPPKHAILFIGSSGIRKWRTLAKDFPGHKVINRGFGGSEMIDSAHFAERIVLPCEPRQIFVRAGGNDLAAGKTPEQVVAAFKELVAKVHAKLPETEIVCIGWNPTIKRLKQADKEKQMNALIAACVRETPRAKFLETFDSYVGPDGKPRADLLDTDKLHFSPEGYRRLADLVRPLLSKEP